MIKRGFIFFIIFTNFLIPNYFKAEELLKEKKDQQSENKIDLNYLKRFAGNDYILGPGDQLFIRVSRNTPELNSLVSIDGEGSIYLPKINRIFVKGLTIIELNQLLNKSYKEFVKFSDVESQIIRYRPIRVMVKGEVNRPGLYNLDGFLLSNNLNPETTISSKIGVNKNSNIADSLKRENSLRLTDPISKSQYYFPSVFDAIRKAGGVTELSDLSKVEVIRIENISSGGGKKKTILDFASAFINGDISQNIRILDGDIIKINKLDKADFENYSKALRANINPYFINVIITGRVKNPGSLVLPKSSSLTDAVLVAGGPRVISGKLNFIRYNNDGTIDRRKIKFNSKSKRGSFKNPILKNNDLIFLDDSLLSTTAEVFNEISSPFTGFLSMYGLLKAFNEL